LALRGQGKEQSVIKGKRAGYPVVWIESGSAIEVMIEGLTISEAKRFSQERECAVEDPQWICPDGIKIRGKARATISGNEISENGADGIYMQDSAQAIISDSEISGNDDDGIDMRDSTQATISGSKISENDDQGIIIRDSAQAEVKENKIKRRLWCRNLPKGLL